MDLYDIKRFLKTNLCIKTNPYKESWLDLSEKMSFIGNLFYSVIVLSQVLKLRTYENRVPLTK